MTTHLVIADRDTITALHAKASSRYLAWFTPVRGLGLVDTQTDDHWIFLTPDDPAPSIGEVGSIFGPDWGLGNSLPLIAACDALGVDEL